MRLTFQSLLWFGLFILVLELPFRVAGLLGDNPYLVTAVISVSIVSVYMAFAAFRVLSLIVASPKPGQIIKNLRFGFVAALYDFSFYILGGLFTTLMNSVGTASSSAQSRAFRREQPLVQVALMPVAVMGEFSDFLALTMKARAVVNSGALERLPVRRMTIAFTLLSVTSLILIFVLYTDDNLRPLLKLWLQGTILARTLLSLLNVHWAAQRIK